MSCPAAQSSTVLAVVGDWGINTAEATSVAAMVASSAWQTDFVLTAGDNNYGNTAIGSDDWDSVLGARYGQFMKKRAGPSPNPYPNQTSVVQRFFPAVGNHDASAGDVAGYVDYFHADPDNPAGRLPPGVHSSAQSYYDFDLPIDGSAETVRIFAMDSESFVTSPSARTDQISWLCAGLKSSPAAWNFVLLHRAPYSSGLHSSDPFLQLPFQQWGAHAVLAGHDHIYERLRVTSVAQDEMLYFVNGLGGAVSYTIGTLAPGSEVRYNDTAGAMRISLTDQQAVFEFLAVDGSNGGALIDSFTLLKSNLPQPPELTADFNDDGFVDHVDLATWSSAFGPSGLGDADDNGDADGNDFLAWQRQHSPQPAGPPPALAIPEPASTCLALGGGLLLIHRRLQSRGRYFHSARRRATIDEPCTDR